MQSSYGVVVSVDGPGVTITIKTKYKTFTPDQFITVFQQGGYTSTQVAANISENPVAAPVHTVAYSKVGLLVFFNDNENLIKFHVINRKNVGDAFNCEIMHVLKSLNYYPSAVDSMRLEMTSTVSGMGSPITTLKSLICSQFVDRLEVLHSAGNVAATSLKFTQSDDNRTEFLTTTIEPLNSDPGGTYFAAIEYVTRDNEKFTGYIAKIGDEMVERIISEAENNG